MSGFGLTQQNRTRGGDYGEGENLRSYTLFLVLTGALLFPKTLIMILWSVFVSSNTELPFGWGEELISIPGVLRASLVLVESDTSQQLKQRRKIPRPDSSTG